MNNQEAIERLGFFPDWNKDDFWMGIDDMEELTKIAISAIKKQIPNKPIRNSSGDLACSCGLIIQMSNKRKCLYFCHNCGQAIDWSDSD